MVHETIDIHLRNTWRCKTLSGSLLKERLLSLWTEQSNRDKQRLVGASNLSNECTRCLAEEMALMLVSVDEQYDRVQSEYVMGAKIGTCVHLWLEEELKRKTWAVPETRVIIGEIQGYGILKSTADLYVKDLFSVVDHKTTTIEKLKVIRYLKQMDKLDEVPEIEPDTHRQARKKVKRYGVQGNLYGKGIEDQGQRVDTIALNFIPRDAKNIEDMYVLEFDYDRSIAERALARGQKIWDALVVGKAVGSFKSDIDCYTCSVVRKHN